MDLQDAIDELIGEIEGRAELRDESRYTPAPPGPPVEGEPQDVPAETPEMDPGLLALGEEPEDLQPVVAPTVSQFGDLPLAAPPATSTDSVDMPQEPASPAPLGQLDAPHDVQPVSPPSVSVPDLSPPPPPPENLEAAEAQSARLDLDYAQKQDALEDPAPPASPPPDVSTTIAPEGEQELAPSRYMAPEGLSPAPPATEQTPPPLQAPLAPPPLTNAPAIDEPGMFPAGFDMPRFAEMVSDVAAFKMAQREAEMLSYIQDELAVALSAVERRFAI